MLNQILARVQNPHKGWDPIPLQYANEYAERSYQSLDLGIVDELEHFTGGLKNKSLADLGGGPGQYAIEFAKRGAKVTWIDVSRNYMNIARLKAEMAGVTLNFELSYMENARGKYDILFNRVCWYYCQNDNQFMKIIYGLVNDGGHAYLILHDEGMLNRLKESSFARRFVARFLYYLNDITGIKIGHPVPSLRRIKKLFAKYTFKKIFIEKRTDDTVYVLFQK